MARSKTWAATLALALVATAAIAGAAPATATDAKPNRVLIVLFDQMVPSYADAFAMPNYRRLRDAGTNFKNAYLGYMASETVMAHSVIVSGQLPKNMGWVDEAYRDTQNILGKGPNTMHITGDLSLADFDTIVEDEGYLKLADYLHKAQPGKKFIAVGEKSYAVESATAATGDIAVRLSGRTSSSLNDACRATLGGRYRYPAGKNVPAYIAPSTPLDATAEQYCNRFYINSDGGNDYGTKAAFPSWLYPEDGNRMFRGTDKSSADHPGGDVWAADAAIAMIRNEPWAGMFVTLGGIDKAGHMWGAQEDAAAFTGSCTTGTPAEAGAAQTHVRCAAEEADVQLGRIVAAATALDKADGGETLVVLTADHGATYGANYYGKRTSGAGDSNWYWAPKGVWDAGAFLPETDKTYNQPSPSLLPLNADGNLQFSYQSSAIETWLLDRSLEKKKANAATMLTLPGVIASYYKVGDHFVLYGNNKKTPAEKVWWQAHGQELVDTMAADNGPDVVGLLHDKTLYGAYGDHGGAQKSAQRIPLVFWSSSLATGKRPAEEISTVDILPTILQAMGMKATGRMDGHAVALAK